MGVLQAGDKTLYYVTVTGSTDGDARFYVPRCTGALGGRCSLDGINKKVRHTQALRHPTSFESFDHRCNERKHHCLSTSLDHICVSASLAFCQTGWQAVVNSLRICVPIDICSASVHMCASQLTRCTSSVVSNTHIPLPDLLHTTCPCSC